MPAGSVPARSVPAPPVPARSTDQAPAPAGSYAQAAVRGGLLQVSGQLARDPGTGALVGSDIRTQMDRAMRSVQAVLRANGADVGDVLMFRIYLTGASDVAGCNEVFATYVREPLPARAIVYTGLPAGALVEVDALAVVPAAPGGDAAPSWG